MLVCNLKLLSYGAFIREFCISVYFCITADFMAVVESLPGGQECVAGGWGEHHCNLSATDLFGKNRIDCCRKVTF